MKMNDIYVSWDELDAAFNKVRRELHKLGVMYEGSKLAEVDCIHDYIDFWSGIAGYMGFCHDNGNIYIPHTFAAAIFGYERDIVNVLRHEFGHAMANKYSKFFSGRKNAAFKAAFGRKCDREPFRKEDKLNWTDKYVSSYATSASCEDWAETFEQYMRYKGKIPARWAKLPVIRKKWNAVKKIIAMVAKDVDNEV